MKSQSTLPASTKRLLAAIGRQVGSEARQAGIRYEPAIWLHQKPTVTRRQRWSRLTKRLERAGLLERIVERTRNRVTHVRLTKSGRAWLDEHVEPDLLPIDLADIAVSDNWSGAAIEIPTA